MVQGEGLVFSPYVPDHRYDHDHDGLTPMEENPIWQQDNVLLHSVGIDVGSSGTQVVFSRLHLRRIGEELTSRYVVIRRDAFYHSPIALTPYESSDRIDTEALGGIVDLAYHDARITPETVDTGVVILTGEALRRRNAARITRALAERAGQLVCASAGHNMEAMLAAFGSGAARVSYDRGLRLLNLDIGGGTTKLGLIEGGRVQGTAALHVGGRLLVVDGAHRLVRLDPAGHEHAHRAGFTWEIGDRIEPGELEEVADHMAAELLEAIWTRPLRDHIEQLYLTEPIPDLGHLDGIMVSGGVAEYVYHRELRDFGDLGLHLGRAVRRRLDQLDVPLLPAGECIRATVLGASEYSVQLSGNTGWISDPDGLLPRRDLPVVRPPYALATQIDPEELARAIRAHLGVFDRRHHATPVALALHWSGPPTYERLLTFARGLVAGLAERVENREPLYLLLDGDVAMTLGRLLRDEFEVRGALLVIDGLSLGDFDFIDLGRVRFPSNTVPVTIKSLVFNQDPRDPEPSGAAPASR
jgi:ethanolamine utilization protein EutA